MFYLPGDSDAQTCLRTIFIDVKRTKRNKQQENIRQYNSAYIKELLVKTFYRSQVTWHTGGEEVNTLTLKVPTRGQKAFTYQRYFELDELKGAFSI